MSTPEDRMDAFVSALEKSGWRSIGEYKYNLEKGDWKLQLDTSSWWCLGTKNGGIFDIHVPIAHELPWTVSLVEHLCKLDDERFRLRSAVESILKASNIEETMKIAQDALATCYHSWIVEEVSQKAGTATSVCSVCKLSKTEKLGGSSA